MKKMRNKFKIGIIEDSKLIRMQIVSIMKQQEEIKILFQAEDEDEALTKLRNIPVDLVILDINLKKGNGLNLIPEIKEIRPETQVIIFTNHTENAYRKRSMELGADNFYNKSSEFEEMMVTISRLINGRT
jgi:DNA-binding NarL/FixJ family response regulator